MMRTIKKLTALFLTLLMCMTLAIPAHAAEPPPEDTPARAPRGEWRYEYTDPVIDYVEDFAGGQLERGYSFPTGGYFSYNPSGGPSASCDISVGVSFGICHASVSLGIASVGSSVGTGYWVEPDSVHRYKLWVKKGIEARGYTSYYRVDANSPWEKVASGTTYKEVSLDAWPEVCGYV